MTNLDILLYAETGVTKKLEDLRKFEEIPAIAKTMERLTADQELIRKKMGELMIDKSKVVTILQEEASGDGAAVTV